MIKLASILVISLTVFQGCGVDCIDKKTGMHKASLSIDASKNKRVFQFELHSDKPKVQLGKTRIFNIKNAWVENNWLYECINNTAVLKKDSSLQFVVEGRYNDTVTKLDYLFLEKNNSHGCFLGSQIFFTYFGQDTIQLIVQDDKTKILIDTLRFWKVLK